MRNLTLWLIAVLVVLAAGPAVVDFIGWAVDRSLEYEQAVLDDALPLEQRVEVLSWQN